MNTKQQSQKEFFAKVESLKEKIGADLTTAEDLSLAVMNLVSLEGALFLHRIKNRKRRIF